MNDLEKLVLKYPSKNWNIFNLIRNPNITIEFIEKYKNTIFENETQLFCMNPNITPEFIEKNSLNLNRKFNWQYLSKNKNITLEFIEKNIDKPIDWYNLSKNPNITPEFVEKYKNKDWDWNMLIYKFEFDFVEKNIYKKEWVWECVLSRHPKITVDIIKKEINLHPPYGWWDWGILSRYSSMEIISSTMKDPKEQSSFKWVWEELVQNLNITFEFIETYLRPYFMEINFWYLINNNTSISQEFIEKYTDKDQWNYNNLSENHNITIGFIEKNINKDWNWNVLSSNIHLINEDSIRYINSTRNLNPHFFNNWNWLYLSMNLSITPDIVNKYPDLPWNWYGLSTNPNITFEFIEKNIDKINFDLLSRNVFKFNERLQELHFNKLKKIRKKVKNFKLKGWYKLYLLTKEEKFYKWYCAPGNVGNKVDKKRIMDHFNM